MADQITNPGGGGKVVESPATRKLTGSRLPPGTVKQPAGSILQDSTQAPFKVAGNVTTGYTGVDPVYKTYADVRNQPLPTTPLGLEAPQSSQPLTLSGEGEDASAHVFEEGESGQQVQDRLNEEALEAEKAGLVGAVVPGSKRQDDATGKWYDNESGEEVDEPSATTDGGNLATGTPSRSQEKKVEENGGDPDDDLEPGDDKAPSKPARKTTR